MKLDSSVAAVVTGGASGLGAATSRALAAQGVKVAIFDFNEEKGEAIAKEIGGVFCKVDVTSDELVDAGFAKARAAHGQERILVNCAGTGNAVKTAGRDKKTGEAGSDRAAGLSWRTCSKTGSARPLAPTTSHSSSRTRMTADE